MKYKCKVGDQHLAAEGLSSARFDTPDGLVIVSAPAAVISALKLVPGQAVELSVTATPEEDEAAPPPS